MEYKVKLPVFEGPLDLLLHLIEKRELDITAVSLAQVADQYLEYIDRTDELNPDSLADFVVVAAKLLAIKSFALLPSPAPSPEEEDIADELTTALIEYQHFKRAARELRSIEEAAIRAHIRTAKPALPPPAPVFGAMSAGDLLEALTRMLEKAERADRPVLIPKQVFTVSEKVDVIHRALSSRQRVAFGSLLSHAASRLEVIVTFLAVLELLKKREVEVDQAERFGEIFLLRPSTSPHAE